MSLAISIEPKYLIYNIFVIVIKIVDLLFFLVVHFLLILLQFLPLGVHIFQRKQIGTKAFVW